MDKRTFVVIGGVIVALSVLPGCDGDDTPEVTVETRTQEYNALVDADRQEAVDAAESRREKLLAFFDATDRGDVWEIELQDHLWATQFSIYARVEGDIPADKQLTHAQLMEVWGTKYKNNRAKRAGFGNWALTNSFMNRTEYIGPGIADRDIGDALFFPEPIFASEQKQGVKKKTIDTKLADFGVVITEIKRPTFGVLGYMPKVPLDLVRQVRKDYPKYLGNDNTFSDWGDDPTHMISMADEPNWTQPRFDGKKSSPYKPKDQPAPKLHDVVRKAHYT